MALLARVNLGMGRAAGS